jgi:hypothetical protein
MEQLSVLIEGKASKLNKSIAQQFIGGNFTWAVATNNLVDIF